MGEIKIERDPSPERLSDLGVTSWPIWEKEASEFPWEYDTTEICFILQGRVTVTPEGSEPVEVGKGDLVTFPKRMRWTWKITEDIRKHCSFP